MKKTLRRFLKTIARSTPMFRGKGRIINSLDGFLTDYRNPASYLVETVINDTTPFILDLRPWGQRFAYYYGGWELEHVRMNRALYKIAGGSFLDVGSSLGLYTLGLSREVMSLKETIYSFEPIDFNLERQKHNVKLVENLDSHVVYLEIALGSETGRVSLIADAEEADNNAFIRTGADHSVELRKLDDVVVENNIQNTGLIKIDVEGWEPEILNGAKSMLREQTPIVFAEFNRQGMARYQFSMDESWNLLVNELKYSAYVRKHSTLVEITHYGDSEDIYFIPSRLQARVASDGLISSHA